MSTIEQEQEVDNPAEWARQILAQPWGRLVADSMSRTLSYVPNDRPRQLAAYLLPISERADALEHELRHTTELLGALSGWLAQTGEYGMKSASVVENQIVANNKALDRVATSE